MTLVLRKVEMWNTSLYVGFQLLIINYLVKLKQKLDVHLVWDQETSIRIFLAKNCFLLTARPLYGKKEVEKRRCHLIWFAWMKQCIMVPELDINIIYVNFRNIIIIDNFKLMRKLIKGFRSCVWNWLMRRKSLKIGRSEVYHWVLEEYCLTIWIKVCVFLILQSAIFFVDWYIKMIWSKIFLYTRPDQIKWF